MEWLEELYDSYDLADHEQLLMLEYIERRSKLIHTDRSIDLDVLDDTDFRSRYRFNKSTVDAIVELLTPKLQSQTERIGQVSCTEKVCTALRFFAEGCFQTTVGDIAKISQPSASRAINGVAKALAENCREVVTLPDYMEKREINQDFYERTNFPGIIGTLDCTHVPIKSPGTDQAELFRCRKNFFSLNIQTLSDHRLKIRNIVTRWPGGTHDSTIFDHSYLKSVLEGPLKRGFHVLGDSGYPLREYLMTPFLNPRNDAETRYNKSHIYARNSVERQYGVWKKRFACLSNKLRGSLQNTQRIILATAVLHNIAIDLGDNYEYGCDPDAPEPTSILGTVGGIAKRNLIVRNYFS